MDAYIQGEITDISDNTIVVEAAGVGYELYVSQNTIKNIKLGETGRLYTYLAVREDGMSLFGFADKKEKALFLKLIKVNGVGPKGAMDILGGMSLNDLVSAIATGNSAMLCGIKGIGKKTAERLILELKDKLTGALPNATGLTAMNSVTSDIINALIGLGYTDREARAAVKKLPDDVSVSDGIRMALQNIVK